MITFTLPHPLHFGINHLHQPPLPLYRVQSQNLVPFIHTPWLYPCPFRSTASNSLENFNDSDANFTNHQL